MNALARTATTTFPPAVLRLGKMNATRTFAHEATGGHTVMRFATEHVNGRTVMKRTHHEATGSTRRNRVTFKTSRTLLMAQPSEAPSRALSVARYHHEATGCTTLKLFIPAEHEGATACHHEATGRAARL